jgi:hypothetical protein
MAYSWYKGSHGPDGAKNVDETKDQIITALTRKIEQLQERIDDLESDLEYGPEEEGRFQRTGSFRVLPPESKGHEYPMMTRGYAYKSVRREP